MTYNQAAIWILFGVLAGVVVGAPLVALAWKSRIREPAADGGRSELHPLQRPWIVALIAGMCACGLPAAILAADQVTRGHPPTEDMGRLIHQTKSLGLVLLTVSLLYVFLGSMLIGSALAMRRSVFTVVCALGFLMGVLMAYHVVLAVSVHSLVHP